MPVQQDEQAPVLVIGAGWLGEPLARQLQAEGLKVVVTARKAEKIEKLQASGLRTWRLDMEDSGETFGLDARLAPFNTIVWAVPPDRSASGTAYAPQLTRLLQHWPAKPGRCFVFISSTGVYPGAAAVYDETAPVNDAHIVACAEREIQRWGGRRLLLRCGGLADERRVIGRNFSRKPVQDAGSPVNYIHRSDVIGAVLHLLFQGFSGIFNLVAPLHPDRGTVFTQQALRYGFDPPSELLTGTVNRLIACSKLQSTGYVFKYPDPAEF